MIVAISLPIPATVRETEEVTPVQYEGKNVEGMMNCLKTYEQDCILQKLRGRQERL